MNTNLHWRLSDPQVGLWGDRDKTPLKVLEDDVQLQLQISTKFHHGGEASSISNDYKQGRPDDRPFLSYSREALSKTLQASCQSCSDVIWTSASWGSETWVLKTLPPLHSSAADHLPQSRDWNRVSDQFLPQCLLSPRSAPLPLPLWPLSLWCCCSHLPRLRFPPQFSSPEVAVLLLPYPPSSVFNLFPLPPTRCSLASHACTPTRTRTPHPTRSTEQENAKSSVRFSGVTPGDRVSAF